MRLKKVCVVIYIYTIFPPSHSKFKGHSEGARDP